MTKRITSLMATAFSGLAIFSIDAVGGQLDGLPFDKKLNLAKAGDDEAQLAVGVQYQSGTDVKTDSVAAARWYRKSGDQGNLEAQFRLGRLLQEGSENVKKNLDAAVKLYESAARLGHREAQNWLGYSYQHGIGLTQNDKSAVEWYKKAADGGLPVAQNNLGLMYLNGIGIQRDYTRAFALFDAAAKQEDAWGLNNLGGLYEMGWGAAKDQRKALELYKRAATKGNQHASQNMKRLAAALDGGETPADVEPASAKPDKRRMASPSPKALPTIPVKEAPPSSEPEKTVKTDTSGD